MPKEERGPKQLSEAKEALGDMDNSIFNMKSPVDTMKWDTLSQRFHGQEFSIVDDFRAQIAQALEAEYWDDKEFPVRMMKRLDTKIAAIKARQEKR